MSYFKLFIRKVESNGDDKSGIQQFNISVRMLHYYEKKGLISSTRIPDYSYRVYDDEAVKRIQQILVLRKLRIPVKEWQSKSTDFMLFCWNRTGWTI